MPIHIRKRYAHAGDKQLRVAPGPHQPHGAQSLVSSLIITPPLGSAARGGWARGLRLGHAQTHATQPGPPGLVRRASLPKRSKVRRPFERQGGLLSIATQEPNWSRSPSLRGPVLVSGRDHRWVTHARGRALQT